MAFHESYNAPAADWDRYCARQAQFDGPQPTDDQVRDDRIADKSSFADWLCATGEDQAQGVTSPSYHDAVHALEDDYANGAQMDVARLLLVALSAGSGPQARLAAMDALRERYVAAMDAPELVPGTLAALQSLTIRGSNA